MRYFFLIIGLFGVMNAWAGGSGEGHALIYNIALCLVGAGLFGVIMRIFHQPLLLGYLMAGVIIGPIGLGWISDAAEVNTISELGLILLLFMIGLEIDLKKMFSAGLLVAVPGLIQFPLTIVVSFFFLKMMGFSTLDPSLDDMGFLYLAIALGLGSTMIAVKLLYERHELDTLPGRITLGILIFQDLWAIAVLAIQPTLDNPEVSVLMQKALSGTLLVVASLLLSKYVLPRLFRFSAKQPELLVVLSLAWCFFVCLVASSSLVGLSMEMGALIAGVALATFPYSVEVYTRVVSIRDFFMTLFFVALGMMIPLPTFNVLFVSIMLSIALLLLRVVGIFIPLFALRAGQRTATKSTLHLSQISEFSLVIGSIGISLGHIPQSTLSYIIWTFCLLAVSSTYSMKYSDHIEKIVRSVFNLLGYRESGSHAKDTKTSHSKPIVILGYYKIAQAFVEEIVNKHKHMKDQILVVDYNPVSKQNLERMGIPCVYGDVAHSGTLEHAGIEEAQLVICTTSDSFLKGTTNLKLIQVLKELCPNSRLILTAENETQAKILYHEGAHYVLQPFKMVGSSIVPTVLTGLNGNLNMLRERDLENIENSILNKEMNFKN